MGSDIHSLFYSERSIQMIFSINGTMWRVQYENSNAPLDELKIKSFTKAPEFKNANQKTQILIVFSGAGGGLKFRFTF